MRILFAYTFFLVAIANIAVGAPLDNVIATPILERTTLPRCPPHHPVYIASICNTSTQMRMLCEHAKNPDLTLLTNQDCEPEETCIVRYFTVAPGIKDPHATCVDNTYIRKWDNSGSPLAIACSVEDSYEYNNGVDIEVAMMIYASDGKPKQVHQLEAYLDGIEIYTVNDKNNYTQVIQGYNGQKVKYCVDAGTQDKVTAYAASFAV